MKKLLIAALLFAGKLFAQGDSIVVRKDPRVDSLVQKQIQVNDITTRESRKTTPGFRIQVMSSTERNKVFDAKAKIYKDYPELKAYIIYRASRYTLKVGNFKTEDEALPYFNRLSRTYTAGVYIIHDKIELKQD
ncbi:MAG: SPOR domain-containing protein [Bacteroidetes bacterium]|nr:SPOR domain-containing protein [Bacteroidota bacterium]